MSYEGKMHEEEMVNSIQSIGYYLYGTLYIELASLGQLLLFVFSLALSFSV